MVSNEHWQVFMKDTVRRAFRVFLTFRIGTLFLFQIKVTAYLLSAHVVRSGGGAVSILAMADA